MIQQRGYWDTVASDKEFSTPFRFDLFSKYVSKDELILDYGCGYGRTLKELKENKYTSITGVDFSREMILRARNENPFTDFRIIESGKIPFRDNYFDSVVLLAVLTCVYESHEQDMILNEVKRVLKSGGIIYINDFMLNNDMRNLDRYEKYMDKYGVYGVFELEKGGILRHHDENRISEITKSFEDLAHEKVEYVTMNGNRSNGFVYMGRNIK